MNYLIPLFIFLAADSLNVKTIEDSSGTLFKVYIDSNDVYFTYYNGKEWSKPLNISNTPNSQPFDLNLELKGKILVISWKEKHNGKTYLFRIKRLTDLPRWSNITIIPLSDE